MVVVVIVMVETLDVHYVVLVYVVVSELNTINIYIFSM